MKIRTFLAGAFVSFIAAGAFALSAEHMEWGHGPASYLMTPEESTQWKAIKSDADADAFITLFWARRDPTPSTPRNEFREEFEARVKFADEKLREGKTRGSMTEQGKVFVLYGQPTKLQRVKASDDPATAPGSRPGAIEQQSDILQWLYEGDSAKDMCGQVRCIINFTDRLGRGDFRADRATSIDLAAAERRAVQRSITQPDLKEAPHFDRPAAATAQVPAAAPAATSAPVTELKTEALRSAVAAFGTAQQSSYPKIYAASGEYVTSKGETFVPVMLYVPKSAGVSGDVTFFGTVTDASGKNVAAFEEPAKLTASRDDFFVDKSLVGIPAGKMHGVFGLADSSGKVLAMSSTDMELAGTLDKDAVAVSPLILSNNVYPLTTAQVADAPFSFGGVKVIPKADKTFRNTDELWYFFELRNPGLSDAAENADGRVPVNAGPGAEPKIQVKIDVEGTDAAGNKKKMSAPPMAVSAIAMKGVPGQYGVGSSIPLATFKPGDYTFTMKVIDTVKKASYTLSDKFRIIQ